MEKNNKAFYNTFFCLSFLSAVAILQIGIFLNSVVDPMYKFYVYCSCKYLVSFEYLVSLVLLDLLLLDDEDDELEE